MRGNCWLTADFDDCSAALVPFARFRKLAVKFISPGERSEFAHGRRDLIAASFDRLKRLKREDADALRRAIEYGATLYLRGGLGSEREESLRPVAESSFRISPPIRAHRMSFASHPIVPQVLDGEEIEVDFTAATARLTDMRAEPLAMLRDADGAAGPSLFLLRLGAGMIICDLMRETPPRGHGARLDIATFGLGPLLAVNRAAGIDAKVAAAFNIVVDDRPINYDYFSIPRLGRLLEHIAAHVPEAHIDFAWTPAQSRPGPGYVSIMKRFNTGFVWHGFLRHVDHRNLANPDYLIAQGRRAIERISLRFGVRFQPVMVFPFERDRPSMVRMLMREGFLAKVETGSLTPAGGLPPKDTRTAASMEASETIRFVALRRQVPARLDRQAMVSAAALGLPIIVAGHPENIRLRRFPILAGVGIGALSYFDPALQFAHAKKLRPRSLEEIARESFDADSAAREDLHNRTIATSRKRACAEY